MSGRWNNRLGMRVENEKADLFIEDLIKVFRKHGLCISHEDTHGAFVIQKANKETIDWFASASIDFGKTR